MIRIIFLVLFIVGMLHKSHAQRMLPKQKGIELTVGSFEVLGQYSGSLGYTVNTKKGRGNYYFINAEYTNIPHNYNGWIIPQESITGEIGLSTFILGTLQRNISLNIGVAGIGGYEILNKQQEELPDGALLHTVGGAIYGGSVRLSLEVYLNDKITLLGLGRLKFFGGTMMENFRPSTAVGVRINL